MKRIIITIIITLIIIISGILIITGIGTNKVDKRIEQAKTVLLINNHVDDIKSINVYYGNKTYYVSKYVIDNKEYVGIMDTKYNLVKQEEANNLKNIDEDYIIGYKDDKIIYEVKKKSKDGLIYYYYNALDGNLINKINVDR